MKRRIIALFLTVVMLTLTLAGCSYNYSKKDMTEFASFNKDAFTAALTSLKIEDGDFTTDESVRAIKVLDYIYEKLASAADEDEKIKEGAIGAHDVLYYVYYATAVIEGTPYTFFATSMEEAKATDFQLGLSDLDGINKLISDNIPAGADLKDYVYETVTEGTVAAGDIIYVSYKKNYEIDGASKSSTIKYDRLTVPEEGFLAKAIGKSIGTSFDLDGENDKLLENIDGTDVQVEYSDITIHWAVKSGKPIAVFEDVTYTSSKSVTPVEDTESKDLKDVPLTYYVYPVYVNAVSEISATSIIKEVFGKNLTTTSIPMFGEEAYSSKIEAIATLLTELSELKDDLDDAKEAEQKAQETVDKAGDDATEAQKTALSNATQKVEGLVSDITEKNEEIDPKLTELFAVVSTTEEDIVEEYKEFVYDTLEDSYNNEIKYALAEEIYNLILNNVTIKSLPKKAVDEAYDVLVDGYKSDFYTSGTNYSDYNGSFKSYLVKEMKADDYDAALEAVRKEAEEYVEPIVKIYTAAQLLDLTYTDKEYKEFIKINSDYYEEYYGEFNVRAAEQIDKIFDYYLELETNKDGEIEYINGLIPYKKITYTVTGDATVTE